MKKIILGLTLAITMVACTTTNTASKSSSSSAQPSLSNTHWIFSEQVKGNTPTLVFETEKISGNAGCNNYFGSVVINAQNGSLETKGIGSTRMACPNMNSEANYLKLLGQANRYVVKGETLELYKDNLLLLKFNKSSK
ncbi:MULTISPECIES: META domain-containing protein [Amniculibacterium]|uniref:META domain-containing protein n=1 Tax=Amniculibacterium TaxID=2715289 RepID=UPI000F59F233|nr:MULTISPECIES: META domain-containing protein [Amniculibacterium]